MLRAITTAFLVGSLLVVPVTDAGAAGKPGGNKVLRVLRARPLRVGAAAVLLCGLAACAPRGGATPNPTPGPAPTPPASSIVVNTPADHPIPHPSPGPAPTPIPRF